MTLTYAVERWATYWPDAKPLWEQHWQEIALDQERIPLDVDMERYQALDAAGVLHVVTVRDETGLLRGYWVGFVTTHLHYRSTLHALLDVYWLDPALRQGWTGVRLFRVVEQTLRARGVMKVVMGHKRHVHGRLAKLFGFLGYRHIEETYSKLL